jgi:hypothetical protein
MSDDSKRYQVGNASLCMQCLRVLRPALYALLVDHLTDCLVGEMARIKKGEEM